MTALLSSIPEKARGHRPRLQIENWELRIDQITRLQTRADLISNCT